MIASCSICNKQFVEQVQLLGKELSEEEQLAHLGARFAKHLAKKHPGQLKDLQESIANYAGLAAMLLFESEDAYFNSQREELREACAEDIEADVDVMHMGIVGAVYHLQTVIAELVSGMSIDDLVGNSLVLKLEAYTEKLATDECIEPTEVVQFGQDLKVEEEAMEATEKEKDAVSPN